MDPATAPATTRERDFVDFLEGRDFVVEGRLIETPTSRPAGIYPNSPPVSDPRFAPQSPMIEPAH
jgi:hypothetical protein